MTDNNGLIRFLEAQNQVYLNALSEIKNGRKSTHWMWFVFPQISGLGFSDTAIYYGIKNIDEATEYLRHPILGKHLLEITKEVLNIKGKTAIQIFGTPDDLKLRSCMTLFANAKNSNPVFGEVLTKYFAGLPDERTLKLINR